MEKKEILENAIKELLTQYGEKHRETSMEYTFGYMDAAGALRDMLRAETPLNAF
ncbi:MAG: hypothetical protein J6T26_07810 [Firmicutes bacterium]|nr:hypothetical protein [Bacillota bacterium]